MDQSPGLVQVHQFCERVYLEESLYEAKSATLSSIISDLLPPEDSDSEASLSSGDSNNSGDDDLDSLFSTLPPLSELLAASVSDLHSVRYLNERTPIPKDGTRWFAKR